MTKDEIKLLAQAEQMMDDARISYVILRGERVSVSSSAMAEFGLRAGQTINDNILLYLVFFL